MQTLQHWISRYLLDCQYQKGLDPKTIKAYRIDLAQFSALVDQRNLELTREGIMAYIADLHQQYRPKTIRRKIASVKAFCGYLEYEELIKENPFSRLRLKLSVPLILPRTIPLSAIGAILTTAYHMKERAKTLGQRDVVLRDIALLELLFATGVRVSELCALQYSDVRLDEGEIKIYGKGAKERFVQIANPDVLEALYCYQEVYKDIMAQAGPAHFLSTDCVGPSQINLLEASLTSTVNWPEWKPISRRICSDILLQRFCWRRGLISGISSVCSTIAPL